MSRDLRYGRSSEALGAVMPDLIVGFRVLLVIAALVLSVFDLVQTRGRSALVWAVCLLALALALR